jgi:hypothetical protein
MAKELRMEGSFDSKACEVALKHLNQTARGVFGKVSPGGDANNDQ